MDRFKLQIFQGQVADQCDAALVGSELINQGLRLDHINVLWAGVHLFLTGAANVSKTFWGAGGRLTVERAPLRDSLGIGDESPLADTNMRNHFEHFDDRVDRWWAASENHVYVDSNVGPRAMIDVGDSNIFRHYDPGLKTLYFWGDTYDIQALTSELERLRDVARAASEAPRF